MCDEQLASLRGEAALAVCDAKPTRVSGDGPPPATLAIVTAVSWPPRCQAGAETAWQLPSFGTAYLLRPPLVGPLVLVVNSAEVGNNDWNRQSNDQHPAQGANGAKYLPSNCLGHHVTITGGGKKKKREAPASDKRNGTESLFRFPERAATCVSGSDTDA